MCEICRSAGLSRRNFLRTALGGTAAAAFLPGFLAKPAAAAELPAGVGQPTLLLDNLTVGGTEA